MSSRGRQFAASLSLILLVVCVRELASYPNDGVTTVASAPLTSTNRIANRTSAAGFCPDFVSCAKGTVAPCPLSCASPDHPCPPTLKCCPGFCGCLICRDPVELAPPPPKAGSCPPSQRQHDSGSSCVQRCGGDSFCPGSDKCCEDGCITQCVMPLGTPMA